MTSRWYQERGGYPDKIFLNEHEMVPPATESDEKSRVSALEYEMRSIAGTLHGQGSSSASVVSFAPSVVGGMGPEIDERGVGAVDAEIKVAPSSSGGAVAVAAAGEGEGEGEGGHNSMSVKSSYDPGGPAKEITAAASLTTGTGTSNTSTTATAPPPRYLDPKYYCPICSRILKHPIKCANDHIFCHSCLKNTVRMYVYAYTSISILHLLSHYMLLFTCIHSSQQQTNGAQCVNHRLDIHTLWEL